MRFRVLSWNCFGMAQGGLDAVLGGRAPAGERLRDPDVLSACAAADVLCMQELLSRDAQVLFDQAQRAGSMAAFRDHNRLHLGTGTARGSGLGLGVRGALAQHQLRHFDGPRTSWDRLARKGILYGRVVLGENLEVDIITTHLQSGYEPAAQAARVAQLDQVARMIEQVGSLDRPMLVVGDFNINGLRAHRDGDEYTRLRRALAAFEDLGADTDLVTFHPHPEINPLAHGSDPGGGEQRIDYVWLRQARAPERALRCQSVELVLTEPLRSLRGQSFAGVQSSRAFASDHFGLSVSFEVGAG